MQDILNLKLVLEFHTGNDEDGNAIMSKITIANVRRDITSAELIQVSQAFASLVDYPLIDVLTVATSRPRSA